MTRRRRACKTEQQPDTGGLLSRLSRAGPRAARASAQARGGLGGKPPAAAPFSPARGPLRAPPRGASSSGRGAAAAGGDTRLGARLERQRAGGEPDASEACQAAPPPPHRAPHGRGHALDGTREARQGRSRSAKGEARVPRPLGGRAFSAPASLRQPLSPLFLSKRCRSAAGGARRRRAEDAPRGSGLPQHEGESAPGPCLRQTRADRAAAAAAAGKGKERNDAGHIAPGAALGRWTGDERARRQPSSPRAREHTRTRRARGRLN